MALIKEFNVNSHTKVYLWHTVESIQELEKGLQLSEYCRNRLEKMKIEQMRGNFLAVRQLLKSLGYYNDLYYNDAGKPFLKNDKKISISHSHNCVAVIISDDDTGIDIEKKGKRILKIAHKYTNWELSNVSMSNENTILKLIKIWTAKESMYKIHNKSGLNLKDQITIKNFFPTDTQTLGRIVENENQFTHYVINFIELDGDFKDYVISYCFCGK